jgi:hypothetical protein
VKLFLYPYKCHTSRPLPSPFFALQYCHSSCVVHIAAERRSTFIHGALRATCGGTYELTTVPLPKGELKYLRWARLSGLSSSDGSKGRFTHTMPFPCRVKARFTHNMPFLCHYPAILLLSLSSNYLLLNCYHNRCAAYYTNTHVLAQK